MLAANYIRGSKSAQSSIPTTVGIESAKLNMNVSCQTGLVKNILDNYPNDEWFPIHTA